MVDFFISGQSRLNELRWALPAFSFSFIPPVVPSVPLHWGQAHPPSLQGSDSASFFHLTNSHSLRQCLSGILTSLSSSIPPQAWSAEWLCCLIHIHPQRKAHLQKLTISIHCLPLPPAFVFFFYVYVWTRLQVLWGRAVFYLNIDKEGQKEDDKEEGMSFSSAIYRNWICKNGIIFQQHNHKTTAYFRIHTNVRCESKEVTPGTCGIET